MKYSLLVSLLLLAGSTCVYSNTIYVSPASLDVTVGQMFAVDINIDNISDLYAYQFTLSFNPTVVAADSITEGALFADTNNSFFLPGTIDNSDGNTGLTADTLLGGPGVSGPGTLAVVEFTALGAGPVSFDFSNVELYDPSLTNQISVTPVSGKADVVAPEPASLGLVAAALGLMILGAQRRFKQGAIAASHSNEPTERRRPSV